MLEKLKDIINPDVLLDFDTDNGKLTVKETASDSKIKKLFITQMPTKALAFTLDHQPGGAANRQFQQLSPYCNIKKPGINKGCDLVVFWQEQQGCKALVLDLKSDKPRLKDSVVQLNNSALFIKYLLSLLHYHDSICTDNVDIKQALVTTDKRSTRKGVTYSPNSKQVNQDKSFRIETVRTNSSQEASIALSKLAR